MLRTLIIFSCLWMSLSSVWAGANFVTEAITNKGGDLEEALYGSCRDEVKRKLESECFPTGTALGQTSLNDLKKDWDKIFAQINPNEPARLADEFYRKAADEQTGIISCEMDQLRGLIGVNTTPEGSHYEDPVLKKNGDIFIQTVMKDICQKMPKIKELRRRLDIAGKDRDDSARAMQYPGLFTSSDVYVDKGKPFEGIIATQEQIRKKAIEINRRSDEEFRKVNAQYTAVMVSIWKSTNPKMEEFLLSEMVADKPRSCEGADPKNGMAARDYFRNDVILGTGGGIAGLDLNFGNQPGMIYQLGVDLAGVNMLNQRGRAVLFERSNAGQELFKRSRQGNPAPMLAVCRIQKESDGAKLVENSVTNTAMIIGGLGYFLRFARVAAIAANYSSELLAASRVALIAAGSLGVADAAIGIQNSCFSGTPSTVYNKKFTGNCEIGGNNWADEIQTLESENCALNLALGGLSVAGGLSEVADLLREGKVAKEAVASAAAATARRERVADLGGIVAEAKPTRAPAVKLTAQEKTQKALKIKGEISAIESDRRLIDEEIRATLGDVSPNLNRDAQDIFSGKIDDVIARYPKLADEDVLNLQAAGRAADNTGKDLYRANKRLAELGTGNLSGIVLPDSFEDVEQLRIILGPVAQKRGLRINELINEIQRGTPRGFDIIKEEAGIENFIKKNGFKGAEADELRGMWNKIIKDREELTIANTKTDLENLGNRVKSQDIDCKELNLLRSTGDAFHVPSKCKEVVFEQDVKGEYCSCNEYGTTKLRTYSLGPWLTPCANMLAGYLTEMNQADITALPDKLNGLNRCYKVDVGSGTRCFHGGLGPTFRGFGGLPQMYCGEGKDGDIETLFSAKKPSLKTPGSVNKIDGQRYSPIFGDERLHTITDAGRRCLDSANSSVCSAPALAKIRRMIKALKSGSSPISSEDAQSIETYFQYISGKAVMDEKGNLFCKGTSVLVDGPCP